MTNTYDEARNNVAKFEEECKTYSTNLCLEVSKLILKVSKVGTQKLTIYPINGITSTTDDDVCHSVEYNKVEGYEHSKVKTAIRKVVKWLKHEGFKVTKYESCYIVTWGDDDEYL